MVEGWVILLWDGKVSLCEIWLLSVGWVSIHWEGNYVESAREGFGALKL